MTEVRITTPARTRAIRNQTGIQEMAWSQTQTAADAAVGHSTGAPGPIRASTTFTSTTHISADVTQPKSMGTVTSVVTGAGKVSMYRGKPDSRALRSPPAY